MSVPVIVFNHILFQRIKQQSEEFIEEIQYGFCPNKGTVDPIFILQQTIEKVKESKAVFVSNLLILNQHSTQYGQKPFRKCYQVLE